MARLAPEGCSASTSTSWTAALADRRSPAQADSEEERAAFGRFARFGKRLRLHRRDGEHPQTIGYSLLDSPVGLAAWMLDHDADSYEKISRAFVDGTPWAV